MSGLFGELQRTTQALAAQSQGVFTAGNNLANVNNPAYARQRVVLGDLGVVQTAHGPESLGVTALGLQSIRDKLLDSQVAAQSSVDSFLHAQSDAYQNAQTSLGQNIKTSSNSGSIASANSSSTGNGIAGALDSLFNSFNSLAASPRSTAERQNLFQQAQNLTTQLKSTDSRLASVQNDLTNQISSGVQTVNDILKTISSLNQQIGQLEVGRPGSALDLRDQRQAKLEQLSQYMDVSTQEIPGSTGQIRILAPDAGGAGGTVNLLEAGNPPAPITFTGTGFAAGNPPVAIGITSGSMPGALQARDGVIADMRAGLDSMARQLVTSVNAAYNPGGISTNFFNAAGVTAATIALDPTLDSSNIRTTTSTDPGANDVATAVANLATTGFSTGAGDAINGTFSTYFRGIVSNIGNAAASAQNRSQDQSLLLQQVKARRDSVSGVSMDEEMTDLIKYQRAYDASARVMRTIDQMLQTVVSGLVQ